MAQVQYEAADQMDLPVRLMNKGDKVEVKGGDAAGRMLSETERDGVKLQIWRIEKGSEFSIPDHQAHLIPSAKHGKKLRG